MNPSISLRTRKYIPKEIEEKWQKKWEEQGIYKADLDNAKKPFYNLMMFPYPSAEGLHVGNMYAFTGSDIYGRYKRMKGFDVFEPIGLDGFGIHSENYAIKVGVHPKKQAKISQENFYRQLHATGNAYDWSRTLETYDPDYYKWTQWIFIQLFKKGLAYRKKAPVNFCPKDKTVLADEQVIDGKCERDGARVEKRELEQWFFKITKYADRLLENLETINWSERVKIAQKLWIGKKEGINITYEIEDSKEKIECFTTRPDTNFGATFIVVGPEHPLIEKITEKKYRDSVHKYISQALSKSETERIAQGRKKTGVFIGSYAINNLNGERLPIWVSDFVLGNIGTGAVVGVPGHDKRDFEFAQVFGIPIVRVVVGKDGNTSKITRIGQVQEKEGVMVNSEFLNKLDIHQATKKIMDYLEEKGLGKRVTSYHLRDWLISRQRYWGPPIPMIYCPSCASKGKGWFSTLGRSSGISNFKFQISNSQEMAGWFPEENLPVLLPEIDDWKPKGTGKSPLDNIESFVNTTCPNCKGKAKRETDVSDTFLDSAWYYLGYLVLGNQKSKKVIPSESKSQKFGNWKLEIRNSLAKRGRWLPVNMYIGGAEHSVLHLLYARFLTMFFKDLGLISFEEPFTRFYAHGLLIKEGAKMSKSKSNVVIPDSYIEKYGADTLRTYLMFLGPFNQGGDFYDSGMEGIFRFLNRVYRLISNSVSKIKASSESLQAMHKSIKRVTEDMDELRYNTVIAALMEWYNFMAKQKEISKEEAAIFLKLLAPFAPHISEELFGLLNPNSKSVHLEAWPKYDPKLLVEDKVTIAVAVNGKFRATVEIESSKAKDQKEIENQALKLENVNKHLNGKKPKKVIYVEGRIINFVY